jgi:hypothetical protein
MALQSISVSGYGRSQSARELVSAVVLRGFRHLAPIGALACEAWLVAFADDVGLNEDSVP